MLIWMSANKRRKNREKKIDGAMPIMNIWSRSTRDFTAQTRRCRNVRGAVSPRYDDERDQGRSTGSETRIRPAYRPAAASRQKDALSTVLWRGPSRNHANAEDVAALELPNQNQKSLKCSAKTRPNVVKQKRPATVKAAGQFGLDKHMPMLPNAKAAHGELSDRSV